MEGCELLVPASREPSRSRLALAPAIEGQHAARDQPGSPKKVAFESVHEIVHRQHEFTALVRMILTKREVHRLAHDGPIAFGQGQLLVPLTQLRQQAPDMLGFGLGILNPTECNPLTQFTPSGLLQSMTIKLTTPLWTLVVDAAGGAVQTGAWLVKSAALPRPHQFKSRFFK